MFRSVPRAELKAKEQKARDEISHAPTKYNPHLEVIQKNMLRNIKIGNEEELANKANLELLLKKIKPDHICSRGVTRCFSSVRRV